MSDLAFAQPERRSYLLPAALAFAALLLALGIARHFFPATTVNLQLSHLDVVPTRTIYKAKSIQAGVNQTSDVLFIVTALRVDNQLRVPIFVEDVHLTVTEPDSAELTVAATTKAELVQMEQMFPQLRPLIRTAPPNPASIEAGKSANQTAVFALNLPQSLWDARKSAVIKVDLYHQAPAFVSISKP